MSRPADDQIDVSLFGPGYGECCLIHIGNGRWIVVDSCVDLHTRQPVALQYLRQIGIDPSSAVILIVATHWHDDHVRGISELLQSCANADFVLSTAMSSKEFVAMTQSRKSIRLTNVSSGIDEIDKVLAELRITGRTATRATANRLLKKISASNLVHGFDCAVTALSPSDKQIEIFLADLGELMPDITKSEARAVARSPNHLAVVTWVAVGPVNILLGADLEETSDPSTGWTVVVNSTNRPGGKASIFKVPHHGSQNAHNDDVWSKMLSAKPIAILTPYSKGRMVLPREGDVSRIVGLSGEAYLTAKGRKPKSGTKRAPMVERTLRESGLTITAAETPVGQIRLRNGGGSNFVEWTTDLFGTAYALA